MLNSTSFDNDFLMLLTGRLQSWWRHQMETFSALLALCVGNSPVNGEFPSKRPVMQRFDVFFDLCLNKWLNKQSWGWWFETPPCSLWRHCNGCAGMITVWCHYNMVNFLTKFHKRHPIAHLLGWGMACLLWVQHLIDILPQFLKLFMQYLAALDPIVTALDFIWYHGYF